MALRDKLRARVQPMLEPGEQIRHIFLAQQGPSPYLMFISFLFAFLFKMRIVAVTDRRIALIASGIWMPAKPKALAGSLARSVRLGPVSGLWAKVDLGGDKYYVHKRFHKDVNAADAESGLDTPPAPPA